MAMPWLPKIPCAARTSEGGREGLATPTKPTKAKDYLSRATYLQGFHQFAVKLVEREDVVQSVHKAVVWPSLQVLHDSNQLPGGVRVGKQALFVAFAQLVKGIRKLYQHFLWHVWAVGAQQLQF